MAGETLQTSPVAPPSIALALMAWKRVWHEVHGYPPPSIPPFPRKGTAVECGLSASARYYLLIDRMSVGAAP